ncbi:MAG: hypothetical protein PF961_03390 [Planctomycetota bacterium]|jgi:HPt (histidine-containing phosphotransfer) domain-containing protein|nr:hypothetical protein [Planctomycetota bacterium]
MRTLILLLTMLSALSASALDAYATTFSDLLRSDHAVWLHELEAEKTDRIDDYLLALGKREVAVLDQLHAALAADDGPALRRSFGAYQAIEEYIARLDAEKYDYDFDELGDWLGEFGQQHRAALAELAPFAGMTEQLEATLLRLEAGTVAVTEADAVVRVLVADEPSLLLFQYPRYVAYLRANRAALVALHADHDAAYAKAMATFMAMIQEDAAKDDVFTLNAALADLFMHKHSKLFGQLFEDE